MLTNFQSLWKLKLVKANCPKGFKEDEDDMKMHTAKTQIMTDSLLAP